MRVGRDWIVVFALLGALGWAGAAVSLPPGWRELGRGAGFAALGWSLDGAVRGTWPGLPLYRRHLGLFLGLVLAAGITARLAAGAQPWLAAGTQPWLAAGAQPWLAAGAQPWLAAWVAGTLGAGAGLSVTCVPALNTRRLGCLGWVRGRALRPEPAAPLILVADPHWSAELTGLAQAQAGHPEADWLFLGDVFDAWVGIEGMGSPLQAQFLAWVDDRRRAGRWVGLWLGNREFFLDGLAGHFDLMGEGTGGALPGEGLAWEHGDLVNAADWRYRLWNLISRSGPMWLFALSLPKPAARGLADWLHRALHTTNRAYKLTFPREAFRRAAAEHPSETFITGHFHTHEVEGNGIALPWAHEGAFMVWRDRQVKPLDPSGHP